MDPSRIVGNCCHIIGKDIRNIVSLPKAMDRCSGFSQEFRLEAPQSVLILNSLAVGINVVANAISILLYLSIPGLYNYFLHLPCLPSFWQGNDD